LMKPYEKFLDFIIYGSNLYGKKIWWCIKMFSCILASRKIWLNIQINLH
jgi:hypothetical protein